MNSIKSSQTPVNHGILLLFLLFLLLTSITYLIFEFYSAVAGLCAKKGLVDLGGNPIGHDFIVFWSASKVASSGNPSAIYSLSELNATSRSVVGADVQRYAWNYPPTFLLIVYPLSFFPYLFALIIWITGSLLILLRLIHSIFSHPFAPWIFLCFPSIIYNLIAGQNGFFTTIFLCGGLLLLDRTPFVAGLLLGIMSYKPQLFVLLPLALISGRYWWAFGGMIAGVSGLALASLVVFGSDLWQTFIENIPFAVTHWQTKELLVKMPTTFAFAQSLGINILFSTVSQVIVTAVTIGIVIWTWSRETALAFRGSVLSLCIALCSPYLFSYDLAVVSLPFAWMGWLAFRNRDKEMLTVLITCWIGLFFSIFFPFGVNPTPIILGTLLAYIVYRMRVSEMVFLHEHKEFS